MTTVQYAVHTVNHAIDVNHAHNSWAGPFDLISLGLATLQFAALLWIYAGRAPEPNRSTGRLGSATHSLHDQG